VVATIVDYAITYIKIKINKKMSIILKYN